MIGTFLLELKEEAKKEINCLAENFSLSDLIKNFNDVENIKKHCDLLYHHNGKWKKIYYYSPNETVPAGEYTNYPNKLFNLDVLIMSFDDDDDDDNYDVILIILSNTLMILKNDEVAAKGFKIHPSRCYFTLELAQILKLIGNGSHHYYRNVKNRICSREAIEEYIRNSGQINDYVNRDRYDDYNFNEHSETLFKHAFIPINSYEYIYEEDLFEWSTLWRQFLCTDGKTEFIVTIAESD